MEVAAMGNDLLIKRVPSCTLDRNCSWAFLFTKLSEIVKVKTLETSPFSGFEKMADRVTNTWEPTLSSVIYA